MKRWPAELNAGIDLAFLYPYPRHPVVLLVFIDWEDYGVMGWGVVNGGVFSFAHGSPD